MGQRDCQVCIDVMFFRILTWGCLISNLSQTHSDSTCRCKDTSPTYSLLTINLCSGPPITSRSLGIEFYDTLHRFKSAAQTVSYHFLVRLHFYEYLVS